MPAITAEISRKEARAMRFRWLPPTIRLLECFLRALPPRLSLALGRYCGQLVGYFCSRENKIADLQLRFAAAGDGESSKRLRALDLGAVRRKMYGHLGESYIETILAPKLFETKPGNSSHGDWFPNYKHLSFDCDTDFLATRERGDSIVTLTAHHGCFELLAPFYERMGVGVSVFRRLSNYPAINKVHEPFLEWTESDVIWRDDPKSARKILRCLKSERRTLAGLMDQDIDLDNAFSNFFGLEAAVPVAAVKLGVKLSSPIFTAFIHRTAPMKHTVVTKQIDYDPDDPEAEQKILAEYHRRLEFWMSKYPEQWVWLHRRWRRRPGMDYQASPEALRSTKEYLEWLENLLKERELAS